jgi:hypothetical protein
LIVWSFLPLREVRAQVFPQVQTPESRRLQQNQENQKLAMQYYENREFEKALDLFRDLYHQQQTHFSYTYYLYCLIALQDYSEAEKLIKSKMKDEQGSYRYEVDLGYLYLLMNKVDKATKQFEDILKGMPPHRSAVLEIANAFTSRQQYEYALKTYLKGRELLQNTEPFHMELARSYELTGDYSGMIDAYLDMLEYDPSKLEYVQGRLQNTLTRDIDDKIGDALRAALLTRNQRNPDNRYYAEMLLWFSIQRKDFSFALIQARSLDMRFNEGGMMVFSIGNLSLANEEYGVAMDAYKYILDIGPMHPYYTESLTGALRAKYLSVTRAYTNPYKDLVSLKQEYISALDELGKNARTIYLMRDLAHLQAFYLDQLDEALDLLELAVTIPGAPERIRADIKLELGDIYLFSGEIWEASLLYSQVEKAMKHEPIGHEAKFRNGRLSYFIGEFDWARAQLDVLKAATSKLIANDAMELSLLIGDNMDPDSTYLGLSYFARADLLVYRGKDSLALITLDSIHMLGLYHPLDDNILYRKAEIYIRRQEYQTADSLLARIVSDYPYDILADNALFKRAELRAEALHDTETAMQLYKQMMLDYPGSLFVTEARKRFRHLRGDFIN